MLTKPLASAALSAAIAATLTPYAAQAQDTSTPSTAQNNAAQQQAASSKTAQTLQQVVVTGNAALGGIKKIDASYSVTSLTAEQIKEANPKSTADLLKASPGISVQSSGGQTGANIEIAGFATGGDAPYVTLSLMGTPLYPMSNLSFMENTTMFRLDDTIERAEIVQGGPSVLYGNGQPGATANFILKQGTDVPSGDIGVTYGSEGLYRLDGFLGGKLAENWYASVGGFWRRSDGVRNPQFPADNGGQLTATLTRDWDNGSLVFYARALRDHNQWVTDTPILNPSAGQFAAYPDFDPLTGTFGSKADQREFIETTPCNTAGCTPGGVEANLARGRGAAIRVYGANFDWDFGNGWTLSDNLGFMGGQLNIVSFLNNSQNPTTLGQYITTQEIANGLPTNLSATATYTNGQAADMNENVTQQGLWVVHKRLSSVSNEFHVSKELFEGNTLTLGNYTAIYNDHDTWFPGNNMLLQARSNPNPIMVSVNDGTNLWQLSSPQGFTGYVDSNGNFTGGLNSALTSDRWYGFNTAFFFSDSWKVGNWLFDGGMRVERQQASGGIANTVSGVDLDGNPYTLYDNNSYAFAPGMRYVHYVKTQKSWTLGGNYEFNPNMSGYVRANLGVHLPGFDYLASNPNTPVQKIKNYEMGLKYQASWIYADVSVYRRLFYNVPYSYIDDNGDKIYSLFGAQTKGLNFTTTVKPIEHASVSFSGGYVNGGYYRRQGCVFYTAQDGSSQCGIVNGKQLQLQPKFQARLTPAYELPTSWGSVKAWITYEYIGNRYYDLIEQQPLGQYHDISFGVEAKVGPHWVYSIQGTNVTNQIGITEGNGRQFGFASGGGVILARSIEGREVQGQIKYNF